MVGLYNSEDWKSLHPIDRAQLLLVIEGLKPGAIIGANWDSFQRVVAAAGLVYEPTSRHRDVRLVARVARAHTLDQFIGDLIEAPKNASAGFYHGLNGHFLGYPSCCTEEYVRPRTQDEMRAYRERRRDEGYTFGRELAQIAKDKYAYPVEFDFRPPSFTPCSVSCKSAQQTLATWKETLEGLDSEAAEGLKEFNRSDHLISSLHEEYLRSRAALREPERQMRLRKWFMGEYNYEFARLRRH